MQAVEKRSGGGFVDFVKRVWRDYSVVVVFFVIVGICGLAAPRFLNPGNLLNILRNTSIVGSIALGMTLVIIAGGIDLSSGPVFATAGAVLIFLQRMVKPDGTPLVPLAVAILVCCAVAVTFGFVNGIVITKAKLPPFIVTLAVGIIARSVTMYICRGATIMGNNIPQFTRIGSGSLLGIPIPFLVVIVMAVVLHIVLTRTKYGTYVFAVGGNENAARYSGIKVDRIRIITYMLVGLCAGIAATMEMSRMAAVAAATLGKPVRVRGNHRRHRGRHGPLGRQGPAHRHHRRVHHPRDRQQHDDHAQYIALSLRRRQRCGHPLCGAHAETGAVMRYTSFSRRVQMKRTVLVLIAALLLIPCIAMFAEGSKEQAGAKKFKIAVSLPPANNAWQAKMLDSVIAVIATDTDKFEIIVKNAVDDADQLNQLQTFKAGGYDMICVLPGNGTLMTPICRTSSRSGTKTMIIDRPIANDDYTVFYGGDNAQCGRNAAKYVGDRLKGKGQIAILRSYVGSPIDLARYNGFMDVLKKDYPGIKVLVEADGEFNQEAGRKAMSNILPAYPKIDAVFTHDDEAAVGALTEIRSAKRTDIQFVTGMGGSRAAFKLMAAKDPQYGASMSYLPTMGGRAVALAKKILLGEKFEKWIVEPSVVVTSENVAKYASEGY